MSSYKDWIRKIDIDVDYFAAFVKAWIAFNSWYRSEYTEKTDREIIDRIKTQNNHFKGYIESLLDKNNTSDKSTEFRDNLDKLQNALVSAAIVTQERSGVIQQILFSQIAINNPKNTVEEDYRRTHYSIKRTQSKIITIISTKGDPTTIHFRFEQDGYDETIFDSHPDFIKLAAEKQGQCKAFYKEICPYVTDSVLTKDSENRIVFIDERAKVSRGIIEVLYLLRCSLLHGDVFPDCNSAEVYKYAYFILATILKNFL